MTEIKTSAEFVRSTTAPNGQFAQASDAGLRDAELRKLLQLLTTGEDALARRKDLTELHKRIVSMFTTLNQGLVESQAAKAAEDRTHLVQRLDQIERAVNGMEGALRIELEPLIRNIVAAAVSRDDKVPRQNAARPILKAVALCVVIALSVYYSAKISSFVKYVFPAFEIAEVKVFTPASLIGGIAMTPILMS